MSRKTTLIAAFAVCSAASFMIGRISSDPSNPEDSANGSFGAGLRQSSISRMGPRAADKSSARDRSPRGGSDTSLSKDDRIAMMISIISNPDRLERAEQWLRFVKGIDPADFEEIIASFRDKGLVHENPSEYSMLLSAWAKYDPLAALDYAEKNTSSNFARQTILATWASTDPAGAIRWAEENHQGGEANPWMVGVIDGIAATDPARATELLSSMPYSSERTDALDKVMRQNLKEGPDVARSWALGIQDDRLRASATYQLVNHSQADMDDALKWLLTDPGARTAYNMGCFTERMDDKDPQAAISYFHQITDESLKRKTLEGITNQLAARDPQAALELIESNSAYVTDHVMEEFVWGVSKENPTLAANNISRIQNERERIATYRNYMWQWMQVDMDGALTWANQSDLPDNVRRQIDSDAEHFRQR